MKNTNFIVRPSLHAPFSILLAALLLVSSCATTSAQNEEPNSTDEKVDIGYGSIEQDKVVGSISIIDGEETQNVQPETIADMLRGRAAGVQVREVAGGGIQVRIRGNRSFYGGNDPLYVIDDMAIQAPDGILYHINPRDVDSITVLKDASSTAIYGSRGANGVILIKTKRGSD